ncbi:tyrosine-type recombinase/integrase [Sphingomicrobium sediminis]|uniref:Tyrosine-type recombinase/integrase n=1 Tax=Sphingomicrobium sediminis TaxID=2950949 RepID=A0A9X2EHI9_9SPHN|nr:tyrosine-type recombinase/integrase [Sphingomicrobium sediminis]MCM8557675.1 tyrosine-type recombinase/integrase [Sphingomicrobium sediminis]
MGMVVRYIAKLKTGRLQFRRAYPKRLQPLIGASEFVRTFGFAKPTDPAFMERYSDLMAEYDRIVGMAKRASAGEYDELSHEVVEWAAEVFKIEWLRDNDAARADGTLSDEKIEADSIGFSDYVEDASSNEIIRHFRDDALRLATQAGLVVDPASTSFAHLCRRLAEARCEAASIAQARLNGAIVPTPLAPSVPEEASRGLRQSEARLGASPAIGFVTLAREEAQRVTKERGESTLQALRAALQLWERENGDIPPTAITRLMVTEFIDVLRLLPKQWKKANSKASLSAIAAKAKVAGGPTLAAKTVAQHVGSLSAIWNRMLSSGRLPEGASNPFAKHSLPKQAKRKAVKGLTRDEAIAIFQTPVFRDGERPRNLRGEAGYFLPLLLLATGARPEEIAQLVVDDLRFHDGRMWLEISANGDHPHEASRRLKTEASGHGARRFPLPQFLIRLGLSDYIDWLKAHGEVALFPSLRTKGKRDLLFDSFTAPWRDYLKSHGIEPICRQPARGFRHLWTTEARKAHVPQDAQEYIQGHAPSGRMNAVYGDREPLGLEIDKLDFAWLPESIMPWSKA